MAVIQQIVFPTALLLPMLSFLFLSDFLASLQTLFLTFSGLAFHFFFFRPLPDGPFSFLDYHPDLFVSFLAGPPWARGPWTIPPKPFFSFFRTLTRNASCAPLILITLLLINCRKLLPSPPPCFWSAPRSLVSQILLWVHELTSSALCSSKTFGRFIACPPFLIGLPRPC